MASKKRLYPGKSDTSIRKSIFLAKAEPLPGTKRRRGTPLKKSAVIPYGTRNVYRPILTGATELREFLAKCNMELEMEIKENNRLKNKESRMRKDYEMLRDAIDKQDSLTEEVENLNIEIANQLRDIDYYRLQVDLYKSCLQGAAT